MSINIKARILARKVIFCYFFEQYVLVCTGQQEGVKEEIEKVALQIEGKQAEPTPDLGALLTSAYYAQTDEEIGYLVQHVFAQDAEKTSLPEVDYAYIRALAGVFRIYEPLVQQLVNEHVTTFSYQEMDILDRVIFVLGYAERKELHTPREVVLNEMVELAKRYGDEASPKLINGIAHKILQDQDLTSETLSQK